MGKCSEQMVIFSKDTYCFTDPKVFECPTCLETFPLFSDLLAHYRNIHQDLPHIASVSDSNLSRDPSFKCPLCVIMMKTPSDITEHFASNHVSFLNSTSKWMYHKLHSILKKLKLKPKRKY